VTYDGQDIFGFSVTCAMEQAPSEVQLNSFFGTSGVQSLWGGGRGRTFHVSGLMVGPDATALAAARDLMLSYDDGIARDLVDTYGYTWPRVVFVQMRPTSRVERLAGGLGLCFTYQAVFAGRI
jgi:hypothetical protein